MNTTNYFNYDEASAAIAEIDSLTDELQSLLNKMNAVVQDNINNPNVWKGDSSQSFMEKWNKFAESFPKFVETFKTQSANVKIALDNNRAWEQQNM